MASVAFPQATHCVPFSGEDLQAGRNTHLPPHSSNPRSLTLANRLPKHENQLRMLSIHFTKEKPRTRGTNTYCLGAHNVAEKMTWKLLLALCITLLVSLFYLLILSFCHRVSCNPGWLWAPNLLLHLPRAGIAHMYHYAWLTMFLKSMPSFGHPFWKNKKQYFFYTEAT